MFYGRINELKFLQERYNSKKAELLIIYGRRRIGKTDLLRFFSKDIPHIFFVGRECTDAEQLEVFSRQVLAGNLEAQYIEKFKTWESAFRYVSETHSNMHSDKKKLVIIDEFPYTVYSNKSIPSIIQNLWDETLRDQNLMIILCGSSMSFIEKEILSEKAPLYGRATGIYKVTELDFFTSAMFFEGMSTEDRITAYAILGGVPHYLKQFEADCSIEENIKRNILSKGCILYSEVEFLMKQELRETAKYYTIIEAIALGNTKLNDIYNKTQIDVRAISVYLNNLMELNIVEREYPVTQGIKTQINPQAGLYKIKDSYFRFYFRFVFPFLSELETGDADGVYERAVKRYLNEFVSYPFEEICIQYLRKRNMENALPVHFSKIGRWWEKGNEIDIVALDADKPVLAGECKWQNSKMDMGDYHNLIDKLHLIRANIADTHIFLFSRSGFDDKLVNHSSKDSRIKLLNPDDILMLSSSV